MVWKISSCVEKKEAIQYEGLKLVKYWEQIVRSHDLKMTFKGILRQLEQLWSK